MDLERLSPERIEAMELVNQAHALIDAGKPDAAEPYLEQALQCDPMYINIYLEKGELHIIRDEYESALEIYQKALMIDKQNGEVHFHIGNVNLLVGKYMDALTSYGKAEECGYTNSALVENMAFCYEQTDKFTEAISAYTRSIRMNPEAPMPRLRRAGLLMVRGEYAKAAEQMDEFMRRFPSVQEGYEIYTDVLLACGEAKQVEARMKEAAEVFPQEAVPLVQLARAYSAQKLPDQALDALVKARSLPAVAEDVLRQAKVYETKIRLIKQDYAGANALHKQLLEEEKGFVDTPLRLQYMMALNIAKDYETLQQVAHDCAQLPQAEKELSAAYVFEPLALEKLGRISEAKALYASANEKLRLIGLKDAARVDTHAYRAMCYRGVGEYEKALDELRLVDEFGVMRSEICSIRAQIYLDMGETEKAKEQNELAEELKKQKNNR